MEKSFLYLKPCHGGRGDTGRPPARRSIDRATALLRCGIPRGSRMAESSLTATLPMD